MKNIYETPVIDILSLASEDVLTASGDGFEGEDDNLDA